MAGRYKIGKFEFDSYEEYVRGMTDVKKIYDITHSVDIYDPDTALRLYQLIRTKKLKFYSKIGRQFFVDIADIVAKNTQNIIQEQEIQKKPRHTDHSQRILGIICIVAAIACFIWYFWSDFTNHRGNKVNDYLRKLREEPQETVEMISNDTFFLEDAPEMEASAEGASENVAQDTGASSGENIIQPDILQEYEGIYQENQNFAGWIKIEGTQVDYPVMRTTGDTDFYLTRNFNGEDDINGTLFMDARTNLTNRSTNIIVYGHNMKSGQMFGGLKKYLKEDYFRSHKQISFDTIYEKGTYEIFAVCLAQVQYQDEAAFRYYNFIHADTEEKFNEFLQNITQLSVFADQNMPVYGDELLTLSTCNNFAEDGRLFLVAKKCRDAA